MHFVMEYMSGGELYKRLSSRKRYSEVGGALVALRWEIPEGKGRFLAYIGLGYV